MNFRVIGIALTSLTLSYFTGYIIWSHTGLRASPSSTDKSSQISIELSALDAAHRVMTVSQARSGSKLQIFRYQLTKHDATPFQLELGNLSCGCLSAKLDGEVIKPKESVAWTQAGTKVVEVSMETPHAARDFKFSFALIAKPKLDSLTDCSTATTPSTVSLSGTGRLHILPDLIIEPVVSRHPLPDVLSTFSVTVQQAVLLNQPDPELPSVEGLPAWIRLKQIRPTQMTKDEYLKRQEWSMDLEIDPTHVPSQRQTLTAKPFLRWNQNEISQPQTSVFTIMLTPSGVLSTETVVLKANPNTPALSNMRIPVRSVDGFDFRIISLHSQHAHVKVTADLSKRSQLQWVELESISQGGYEDLVTVETDHPRGGITTIRVIAPNVGEAKQVTDANNSIRQVAWKNHGE